MADDLSLWQAVAIAAITCTLAAGSLMTGFLWHQRRGKRKAAFDLPISAGKKGEQHDRPLKLAASDRLKLCESVRGLLEEEISRGLRVSGVIERLDRLERQVEVKEPAREAVEVKKPALEAAAPLPCHPLTMPVLSSKISAASLPTRDAATGMNAPQQCSVSVSATEPVESLETVKRRQSVGVFVRKIGMNVNVDHIDEWEAASEEDGSVASLRSSLTQLQKRLAMRNVETQDLQQKLRECRRGHWRESIQNNHSNKHLQEMLCEPSLTSPQQADEMRRLSRQVGEISSQLADARQKELQWCRTAEQQRACLWQHEKASREGTSRDLFRKHPAGEIFYIPPPANADGEEGTPWDMESSNTDAQCSPPNWPGHWRYVEDDEQQQGPVSDVSSDEDGGCAESNFGGFPAGISPIRGDEAAEFDAGPSSGSPLNMSVPDSARSL